MSDDPRKIAFDAAREVDADKSLSNDDMAKIHAALDAVNYPRAPVTATPPPVPAGGGFGLHEPPWLRLARPLIGTREIAGPAHTGFIAKGWARLGAPWFNDDETPWCGLFVAHCIDAAGLAYPGKGMFARAKSWLEWGKASPPVLGAVVVFGRAGGGHVGFLAGESGGNFYVLGGNQANAVTITPIAKARALGFRWPLSLPAGSFPLPKMSGGTVSVNER